MVNTDMKGLFTSTPLSRNTPSTAAKQGHDTNVAAATPDDWSALTGTGGQSLAATPPLNWDTYKTWTNEDGDLSDNTNIHVSPQFAATEVDHDRYLYETSFAGPIVPPALLPVAPLAGAPTPILEIVAPIAPAYDPMYRHVSPYSMQKAQAHAMPPIPGPKIDVAAKMMPWGVYFFAVPTDFAQEVRNGTMLSFTNGLRGGWIAIEYAWVRRNWAFVHMREYHRLEMAIVAFPPACIKMPGPNEAMQSLANKLEDDRSKARGRIGLPRFERSTELHAIEDAHELALMSETRPWD
ncbi:hypothetical protein C8R46DRAFT_1038710 [Mycena filopes]|nr:hypothetical protein C8R46DRAFT_1038710 [Mycena filopes]